MTTKTHRAAIVEALTDAVQRTMDDRLLPFSHAFARVAAEWLGYDTDEDELRFIDGKDRGVDFWSCTDQSFDVFQCKTHDLLPNGTVDPAPFDRQGVTDLQRAQELLFSPTSREGCSDRLMRLLNAWDDALRTVAKGDPDDRQPIQLNLHLVILGDALTPGADDEFDTFVAASRGPVAVGEAPVEVRVALIKLDDLISRRWMAENRDWVDSAGRKKRTVDLTPEEDGKWIGDS